MQQGFCLGPVLWLVLINSLLKHLGIDEAWTFLVFAGYIFILACSAAVYRFKDIVRWVLAEIHAWKIEYSLKFSYDECIYTAIPSK